MLLLGEKDIQKAIHITQITDSLEHAYKLYHQKQFVMGQRMQLSTGENTFLLMPCIAAESIGTKIVSVFPDNIETPVTQGLMILLCGKSGQVKAILNGTTLTNMRTGSLGGLAVRHLAKRDAKIIGLVGLGAQGLHQLTAACKERDFNKIVLWNRSRPKTEAFIEKLKLKIAPDIDITAEDSLEKLVKQSDIVITATTSKQPVLPNNQHIYSGKLIIGIGSFRVDMREFPEALFKGASRMYIDTLDAKNETGDVIDPLKNAWMAPRQIIPFSNVIVNKVGAINRTDERPVLFKSTGMALFDLVAALKIYESAVQRNIGQKVYL
ncbi:ornithine cyclodeaminase family protein [Siminovitchia sp. FSL H7-0308]|uniref:Ornithine cyclodeaminase n=1 Tax=Siminovitchia thermophila TaxID=1245522 RepID=A0ABS2R3C2_9BACI|nr:ornithine cyclodeaminase family protein [Siminovitchia thermophila]MBM7714138.1 ornithine cyclodeaminase [Siminovitchia thermophila]ONK24733.1 hypothetical protein BLX87_03570 [Bacillus sp. VT-16-64]